MIEQEDNCAAILEFNKSPGSADVIFLEELMARVKKPVCTGQNYLLHN